MDESKIITEDSELKLREEAKPEAMKFVINLFDSEAISDTEQQLNKTMDIKATLVKFIDDYMANYPITEEQGSKLARLRTQIIIHLAEF